jgi:hypothetical protein
MTLFMLILNIKNNNTIINEVLYSNYNKGYSSSFAPKNITKIMAEMVKRSPSSCPKSGIVSTFMIFSKSSILLILI